MGIKRIISEYISEENVCKMRAVVCMIGDYIDSHLSAEEKAELGKKVYGVVSDGHYDRYFAEEAISKMYFEDKNGEKHYAPFFTEEEVEEVFEEHQDDISDYTIHDLSVTMNMLWSDNHTFLAKFAKDTKEAKEMVTCMSVEYLQDPDAPHPSNKIWAYLN